MWVYTQVPFTRSTRWQYRWQPDDKNEDPSLIDTHSKRSISIDKVDNYNAIDDNKLEDQSQSILQCEQDGTDESTQEENEEADDVSIIMESENEANNIHVHLEPGKNIEYTKIVHDRRKGESRLYGLIGDVII